MKDPADRSPSEAPEVIEEELSPVDERGAEALLELVLAEPSAEEAAEAPARPKRVDGVVVGRLASVGDGGELLVEHGYAASPGGDRARAMVALNACDVGREVALLFEGGDPDRPVVVGLMHAGASPAPRAEADGERLVFDARQEIVLRCGEASITLTRAGKVLIRGAYVLARSSGVHRIQGGSVEIN